MLPGVVTLVPQFIMWRELKLVDTYDPLVLGAFDTAPTDLRPVPAMRHAIRAAMGEISTEEQAKMLERSRLVMAVPALRMRALDSTAAQFEMIGRPLAKRYGVSIDDVRLRVLVGAIVGAVLAVTLTWVEHDGREDWGEMMDRALEQLESIDVV